MGTPGAKKIKERSTVWDGQYKEALQRESDEHVEDYLTHLRTEGTNPKHLSESSGAT